MSNTDQKSSGAGKSGFAFNEYEERGDYHSELRMSRGWLPRYFRRFFLVQYILEKYYTADTRILDLGCGEGVLVSALRKKGYQNVIGLDCYASFKCGNMIRGDLLNTPLSDESVEFIICLDVMEHIPLNFQAALSNEIARILKTGGVAAISVPNMAHLRSRLGLLFKGVPWRNKLTKHPGELTVYERISVLNEAGLSLGDWIGLHLTLSYNPVPKVIFGKFLTKLMFSPWVPPSLCFTNFLLIYKKNKPDWLNYNKRKYSPLTKALSVYKPLEKDPTYDRLA